MKNQNKYIIRYILLLITFLSVNYSYAQVVELGNGSYTKNFPGTDQAGRNSYPSGQPQLSGKALGKPVPTNDWYSKLIKENHAGNMFNYPMALKTTNNGLVTSYIPWGVYDDIEPIVVGLEGLNASKATVSDYSDWTVTFNWNDGSRSFDATSGIAMPFIYFNKQTSQNVQIKINQGNVSVNNEILIVENARYDADFVIYAPSGSTWTTNGNIYTSSLNGKDYWSMAMLPQGSTNISEIAQEYKKYAYVFPVNTQVNWNYDEQNSVVRSDFVVSTDIKEGLETNVLIGLLPHQWDNLASDSNAPNKHSYNSVRGKIKTLAANTFSVENSFKGILPTLPYLTNYSEGFNPADLKQKISQIENDGLSTWTDSYNEGQVMNRLIQTARIADQMGETEARDKMIATVKQRLEDWLSYQASEVAFLFYYNSDWTALIGYPAGHGQDNNINDHHFHWGYFIHAAAFIEQYHPGWANQWGEMVNHLVRDAASGNRNDDKFPFLRNFSPYAGHCWANGFASFPQGNDQESTSESMQFNSSLIHWGSITGNKEIRDLGIYLYTTEQTAIEEYWFDTKERNFGPNQNYSLVSRVWGNSYDNGTFWTSDIAASYGIEMYPIHGGSFYLAHDKAYAQKLWTEITQNTGILNNEANPNLWHDVMWKYLSMIDASKAIELYDSYSDRELKFGISDAQTYHWLHAMNALGTPSDIKADYPIAVAFDKNGEKTYVAHNYTSSNITVSFSDGYKLDVPAGKMATSKDVEVGGVLSSDFDQAYNMGSVNLNVEVSGSNITKVEFYDNKVKIGEVLSAPYTFKASELGLGIHTIYAKVYSNENFNTTNIITVRVGEQLPYSGVAFEIPGIIEAGLYDKFEGGNGQDIAYFDSSPNNNGDFRNDEHADASSHPSEGATLGWISAGEWVEYTVNVTKTGLYNLDLRFASGNTNGGGPMYVEIDGKRVSDAIFFTYTSDWNAWKSKTVNNIELHKGEHVLRLYMQSGEFNLGRMNFTYAADIAYVAPYADAGENILVLLPENSAVLDAGLSTADANATLTYKWEQLYGPSVIDFENNSAKTTNISNLEEGIYKIKLTLSDGLSTSYSDLLVIVSSTASMAPNVGITSPSEGDKFYQGSEITINASASDIDGNVDFVEFFVDGEKIGEDTSESYSFTWTAIDTGIYEISVKATDNSGISSEISTVSIEVTEAPSCTGGPENGDYTYEFSDDSENPTITFIPGKTGTGSPTCILYYGTSDPMPGYLVKPNEPFRINASEGTKIQFYYTYSYDGFERNTYANKHTYVIGSCKNLSVNNDYFNTAINVYPNPAGDYLYIKITKGKYYRAEIYSTIGLKIKDVRIESNSIDVKDLSGGIYILKVYSDNAVYTSNFIKK